VEHRSVSEVQSTETIKTPPNACDFLGQADIYPHSTICEMSAGYGCICPQVEARRLEGVRELAYLAPLKDVGHNKHSSRKPRSRSLDRENHIQCDITRRIQFRKQFKWMNDFIFHCEFVQSKYDKRSAFFYLNYKGVAYCFIRVKMEQAALPAIQGWYQSDGEGLAEFLDREPSMRGSVLH
jgi:hypothetical protein